MSFKVKKLTVGKGQTTQDEKAGVWIKKYYELEMTIEDEHDIEIAKASGEGLLDGWLSGHGITQEDKPKYDMSKIEWNLTEGTSGPYQRAEDVNNPHFKALVKDLAAHNKKLTKDGWFVWLFQNGHTIGRKKRKQS